MDKKICGKCGIKYKKAKWMSPLRWTISKFCSAKCSYFKKGLIPWNTGKTNYLSKEARKNISDACIRRIQNETPEQRAKRTFKFRTMPRIATMLGKKEKLSPSWKGENATYNAKHRWIQSNWQKTGFCELCDKERLPRKGTRLKWGTHWANKSGEYRRDRTDWYELCPKCHKSFDK